VAVSSNLQDIERRSLEYGKGVNTRRKQGARGLLKDPDVGVLRPQTGETRAEGRGSEVLKD